MFKGKFVLVYSLIFAFLCTALPVNIGTLQAQESIAPEALSIVLVIDVSGSMSRTDPQRLRETASRIFVDLLSPDDYLGVITFDHETQVVFPLQQIGSSANKESIKETVAARLDPRGATDYNGALEAAYELLKGANLEETRPVVVFLTDGEPNPDSARRNDAVFMQAYMVDLWELTAAFARERYPIYSVAFSDEIDPEVIRKISEDTRGNYYLLDDPADIAVTFFELLSSLKNRMGILDSRYNLAETEGRFEFLVDEFTRQINLVVVNPSERECEITFQGPNGTVEEVKGLRMTREDKYILAILERPEEALWGKWEASVTGSGSVWVLGDMDFYVRSWLEEPVPFSQHPLNEPIHFKVGVTREDHLRQASMRVEVAINRPGEQTPDILVLEEENGFYTGTYQQVDRTGDYEFQVSLYMDGQLVSTNDSKISVKVLPALTSDFWIEEGYRSGEETVVTASLVRGGNRLPEGADLQVDSFELIIDYEDGEKIVLPLFDSGDTEHGDIRTGDGIWSNRLTFSREGAAWANLMAVGKYRDADFVLDKTLGSFEVYSPGGITVELRRDEVLAVSGGSADIMLRIHNSSSFREILIVNSDVMVGSILPSRITLEPGEQKNVTLELSVGEGVELGTYSVPVAFRVESEVTPVEPSQLNVAVEVMTPFALFVRRISSVAFGAAVLAGIILVILLIIYLGGTMLYRKFIQPRTKVEGTLEYYKLDREESPTATTKQLKLKGRTLDRVVITFDPDNKTADFYIKGSRFNYDLIIEARWDKKSKPFVQGWKYLFKRYQPVETIMRTTQPGVMEFEGDIYTKKELYHSDEFISGDFSFQYINAYGKWHKEKGEGIDLLEGK